MKRSKDMKILWITETAAMTAMLVVLQTITRPLGQYITGSCVNAVLAIAVLIAGIWSGAVVALLSPFFAFLLGIGPQLMPVVPVIALGNLVFVLILWAVAGKDAASLVQRLVALLGAAIGKFITLYGLVVGMLCNVLPLKQPQIDTFTAMFSFPQLVTALAGGGIAMLSVAVLRKALKR